MTLARDWKERRPTTSGKGRLIFYVLLLAFVIFAMLKADTFVSGFARIFFSPDSTETSQELEIE